MCKLTNLSGNGPRVTNPTEAEALKARPSAATTTDDRPREAKGRRCAICRLQAIGEEGGDDRTRIVSEMKLAKNN